MLCGTETPQFFQALANFPGIGHKCCIFQCLLSGKFLVFFYFFFRDASSSKPGLAHGFIEEEACFRTSDMIVYNITPLSTCAATGHVRCAKIKTEWKTEEKPQPVARCG